MAKFWKPQGLTFDQELERARGNLYHKAPVIASALIDLPTILHEEPVGRFDTAWVDGKNIHICIPYFKKLEHEERMFVYVHEILHWLFGHFFRMGHRDPLKWNYATDYAINAIIVEDHGNDMSRPSQTLFDEQYKGLSAEQIYELLPTEFSNKPQQGWGHHDAWGEGFDDGKGGGEGDEGEGEGGRGFISDEQKWQEKLVQAVNYGKMMGNLPAGFARNVLDILNPILPLRRILLPYLSAGASDYTMSPTDRRFTHANMFLPSPYDDENMEDFLVAFDTSGSVTDDDIAGYLGEIRQAFRLFPNIRGWVMTGDAAVHHFATLEKNPPKAADFKGGGGTDFRPFYNLIAEKKLRPKLMMLFTDTYGTWPEQRPRFPHLTVSSTDGICPFGRTIKYVRRR